MRKVLSIVLALAMVLGCFASVFAAEYTDVNADADYATAVTVLSDLGVVSGYTDGTYRPDQVVTRAEMAALIIKALGLTPAASATTNFSDVLPTHWASGYVAYANSLGVIAGYTDGSFLPSKTVSYDEALTMLVSALGYTADSLEGTTWPTAYVMKAQTLGITDDVTVLGSVGANRADIAQLLYNTLDCSIGKTNKDGEFVENKEGKDTMFTRLGASEPTNKVVDKDTTSAIDLSEYFGAEVKAICNKDGKVLAVASVNTEFLTGKYTGTKIGSTAVLSGAFTSSSAIYLNGAKSGTGAPATGSKYTFAVKYNDDGDVKTVVSTQYWKATKTEKVLADVKTGATKINNIQLPTKTVNGKTVLDTKKFELVGVDSIEEIKKNNIVTYYEADGAVVKVEVGTEVVTGKATKMSTDCLTATINGTSYDMFTGTFNKDNAFKTSYDYYLTYDGYVFFYAATESETTDAYAVLVDAAETSAEWKSGNSTWQVKLFTAEGTTETYSAKVGTDNVAAADLVKTNFNKVVEVEFDEDGVVTKLTFVPFEKTAEKGADAEINAKGALDGFYFAKDAVIFTFEEKGGEYEWAVLGADKVASLKVPNAQYSLNDNKQIKLFSTAISAADKDAVKGIFAGKELIGTDKYEVTFMVDGAPVVYTTTNGFTVNGEWGEISFTGEAPKALVQESDKKEVAITSSAAITGNTYTADGTTAYALDANIIVYIVDTTKEKDAVVLGTTADLIDDDYSKVVLYDVEKTADGVYEVAVVFK